MQNGFIGRDTKMELTDLRVRDAAAVYLPALATLGTLAPAVRYAHLPSGGLVLGVVSCLTSARRDARHARDPHLGWTLLRVTAVGAGVGALGLAVVRARPLADVLLVGLVYAALAAGRRGGAAAEAGRTALVVVLTLFVAPVPPGDSPGWTLLWLVLVCAVAALWRSVAARLLGRPDAAPAAHPPAPPRDGGTRARARLAAQNAAALALALVSAQLLFPRHWSWAAVTVLTVSVGARSRGDVALTAGQRLGGALLGTAAGTLATAALHDHRGIALAVLLSVLGAGIYLRQWDYTWWAVCVTTVLALLYGLLGETGGMDLLGQRLAAILLGTACALLPAFLLRPIRTRALARRRAAVAVRALRAALDQPTTGAVRAFDSALTDLRAAVRPLRVAHRLAGGRLGGPAHTDPLDWLETLEACRQPLHAAVAAGDPPPPELRGAYARVGRAVKAAAA